MTVAVEQRPRLLPMGESYLPAVFELERRAYDYPWSEANFRDSLHAGYSAWVLLDPAGDPDVAAPLVGYALMSMAVGEAQLLNICVAPEHRRRGLARQLLDHLLAVARAAAMESMFLEVRPSNASARALYAAYGFAQIGTRRNYYRSASGGEDALVLSLSLSSPVVPR